MNCWSWEMAWRAVRCVPFSMGVVFQENEEFLINIEFNDFVGDTLLGYSGSILRYLEESSGSECNDLVCQRSTRCMVARVIKKKVPNCMLRVTLP